MHETVMTWVGQQVEKYRLAAGSTLEVGSLDVNGSVREFFIGPYIGIDFRRGRGVDRVMNAHDLKFEDQSFDVVVTTEMLEHDDAFWLSLAEMGRVLRKGGALLITTRSPGFGEHGFPDDYWRYMPSSRKVLAHLASCDVREMAIDPVDGIFVHGIRR